MNKEDILKHLYIQTSDFFPIKLKAFTIEFNGYLGKFYYFNAKTGEFFDLDKTLAEELNISKEEAIKAVNKNTKNDLIILPVGNNLNFQLVDINGGHVEKILLNSKRLRKIFRAMNCSRLYFIVINNCKWYVTDKNFSCKKDLDNIFKDDVRASYCFIITSDGKIDKYVFN